MFSMATDERKQKCVAELNFLGLRCKGRPQNAMSIGRYEICHSTFPTNSSLTKKKNQIHGKIQNREPANRHSENVIIE